MQQQQQQMQVQQQVQLRRYQPCSQGAGSLSVVDLPKHTVVFHPFDAEDIAYHNSLHQEKPSAHTWFERQHLNKMVHPCPKKRVFFGTLRCPPPPPPQPQTPPQQQPPPQALAGNGYSALLGKLETVRQLHVLSIDLQQQQQKQQQQHSLYIPPDAIPLFRTVVDPIAILSADGCAWIPNTEVCETLLKIMDSTETPVSISSFARPVALTHLHGIVLTVPPSPGRGGCAQQQWLVLHSLHTLMHRRVAELRAGGKSITTLTPNHIRPFQITDMEAYY